MILLAETPVKYRDGTVKSLDELGGEAKELAPNTPVVNGSTSKPLDEFIQDQIVLSPDTVVVDGEDTTTLEDFIEDEIDGNTGVVHKTGTERITGLKTFESQITVTDDSDQDSVSITPGAVTAHDDLDINATEINLNADTNVDGDLEVDGDLGISGGIKAPRCTNLADYFTAMSTMTVAWVYSQNAEDAPLTQMSWTLIMKSDNDNYGYMFWYGNAAIYCRFFNNGTWGNWAQC